MVGKPEGYQIQNDNPVDLKSALEALESNNPWEKWRKFPKNETIKTTDPTQAPIKLGSASAQPEQEPDQLQQTSVRPEPTPAQSQSAPAQPQQTPVQSEPTPAQPQQASSQPEQAPAQPQQTPVKSEPTLTQPQQASAQPEQAISQPQPALPPPGQTSAQPQQTPVQLGPTPAQPQQASPQPRQETPQPQPTPTQPEQTSAQPEQQPARPNQTPFRPEQTSVRLEKEPAQPEQTTSKPEPTPAQNGNKISTQQILPIEDKTSDLSEKLANSYQEEINRGSKKESVTSAPYSTNFTINNSIPKHPRMTWYQTSVKIEEKNISKQIQSNLKESESNYGTVFGVEKAYSPKKDIITNPKFIENSAAFGLQFLRTGRAFVFNDFWTQYIRIEAPSLKIENFNKFKDYLTTACQNYLKSSRVNYGFSLKDTHGLDFWPEGYDNISFCKNDIDKEYERNVKPMQQMITERYDQFTRKNYNRGKREIVTAMLVAAGIAGVAGFFLGKNNDDNEEKINQLGEEMARSNQKIKLIEEAMVGLSHVTNARFEETDEKMRYLADSTKKAYEHTIEEIKRLKQILDNNIAVVKMSIDFRITIRSEIDKLQNLMSLQVEDLRVWDNIFINLRKGILPRDLFDTKTLQNLLISIEDKLKGEYEIAFDETDWILFYHLPVVAFTVKTEKHDNKNKNYLYLKIKIPLKRKNTQNQYYIISPNNSPFPCLEKSCYFSNITKDKLISFKLPPHIWLENIDSGMIDEEAALSHFSCHRTFEEKLCFTYSPELLKSPNMCTKSIFYWNDENILKYCEFEQRHIEDYRVIKLNSYQFMIHSFIVKSYFDRCPNIPSVEKKVKGWAKVVSVAKGCHIFIPETQQELYGPFSQPLEGSYKLTNYYYTSTLIEKLSEKMKNETKIDTFIDGMSRDYNVTDISEDMWKQLRERMESEKLSDLNKISLEITRDLSINLKKLENNFQTFTYRNTFWGIFAVLGDILHVISTIIVIFGTLTYTRLFGILGLGVVVLRPRPVDGFSIFPKIQVLPNIDVHVLEDVTFVSWISKVILVITFIILLIINITTKCFRTVKMSIHYGSFTPKNIVNLQPKFSIEINIYNETRFCTFVTVENIYIKLPITRMPTQDVFDIKCKNNVITWHIIEKRGQLGIAMSDSLHLIAIDKNGNRIRNRNESIFIPIDQIIWTSSPAPEALKIINNYDLAIINILREPELEISKKKQKKFVNKLELFDEDSEGYMIPTASTSLL